MFHYIHTFIMLKHVEFVKHTWIHTSKTKKHAHFKISSQDEVFTRLFFYFYFFFSSRDEISSLSFIPGWNSWNFISGWNSSRDEILPVYVEMSLTVYTFLLRWNFILGWVHPEMKDRHEFSSRNEKKKKRRVNTSSWDEILKWSCFFSFWRMYSSMFYKFNMFEHNESMNIMKHMVS